MKIYEIRDEEAGKAVGILLYYEKRKAFIIELKDDLDEWTAPLLFAGYVNRHIFTIPERISRMWVNERIIPSGRQNIGSILNTHKLKEYDEMNFLELSKGRCSQDHLYIQKTDELPDYVKNRMKKNLTECLVTQYTCLLCFFADDTIRKIDLQGLYRTEDIEKVLQNRQLLESAKVGVGGYSVNFGESIDIPAAVLYEAGTLLPLSPEDFLAFVRRGILDTQQSCRILECSRQNLAYLQGKSLNPVREEVRGNLYLKGDILRAGW